MITKHPQTELLLPQQSELSVPNVMIQIYCCCCRYIYIYFFFFLLYFCRLSYYIPAEPLNLKEDQRPQLTVIDRSPVISYRQRITLSITGEYVPIYSCFPQIIKIVIKGGTLQE